MKLNEVNYARKNIYRAPASLVTAYDALRPRDEFSHPHQENWKILIVFGFYCPYIAYIDNLTSINQTLTCNLNLYSTNNTYCLLRYWIFYLHLNTIK